ncbi:D-cysteine desulfhydrase [Sporosarcina sp. P26b]|uniref:D-cysteine desulfhydrase family protein n=1 Tax=Sporosarcina sp. P26b TaxID=2048253 RepID=UPI000C165803|nr:D-cysteine desulfhydrase family protein [Sporosarcina sp. P26b]PIC95373.1 D-cysteine desulfhydrase [Sporosarcina sp. P26b]
MKINYDNKVKLGNLPTTIQSLKTLSNTLNGPNIYIKRDDEIGLAFGGNKVRKLEFIMHDALEKKADIIMTSGGIQTNHGRLTVAAANKFGLKSVLVITGEEPERYEGNLLLNELLGAEIHFAYNHDFDRSVMNQNEANRVAGENRIRELVEYYESRGLNVYVVPRGGRCIPGTLGYTSAVKEIIEQEEQMNVKFDYVVTSVGSSSTIGGLLAGKKMYDLGASIIGVSVSRKESELKQLIIEQVHAFAEYFQEQININEDDIKVYDSYVGEGYAIPSELGNQAIHLLAEKESVFIDPVYTGKGMSGLIDLIKNNVFKPEDNVLFIHTGGAPALFAYA